MFAALTVVLLGVGLFTPVRGGDDKGDRDEEGILHVYNAWGLRVGGGAIDILSAKYPEEGPGNMVQTWRMDIYPPDAQGAVKVVCDEAYLPNPRVGCADYTLTIKTEEGERTECGSLGGEMALSKKVTLTMKTGSNPWGRVKCTARGVELGQDGVEVTPPPTLPPRPAYLNVESEEVDSSEHGGPPGKKNTTCACGWANKNSYRIIGGKEAELHEYPFAVGITGKSYSSSFCGGSIFTPYHVLTAAHCVKTDDPELQVAIAEHDFSTSDETDATRRIDVIKVIRHENYPAESRYDIAILVLAERVEYSKIVGPVCIPTGQLELAGKYVKAIGWGMTKPVGPSSPVLKEVNLRVVPFENCADLLSSVNGTDRRQICTYSKKQGVGRGDSGGPLVWLNPETNRYTLVGLPSFVYLYDIDKVTNTLPDVYTDVSSLVHWVVEKVRDHNPPAHPCWAWDY